MTRRDADPQAIAEAACALRRGELVAFPTETVYGLGANATDGRAIASLFAAKGRPRFNPLIVHVLDRAGAKRHVAWSEAADALAVAFWPGPLTLVLPKLDGSAIADLVSAGLPNLALRAPSHPVARALLEAADVPVAAPSANRSGHVSATTAAHVADDLGDMVAMILDGGPCRLGIESTVIGLTGDEPLLLRPGSVPSADIETVLGRPLTSRPDGGTPATPGALPSHYAPRAALRLDAAEPRDGEAFLAFGPNAGDGSSPAINLSPSGDLLEAAASLFAGLRRLDASGVAVIAVAPIPETGVGEAINDRLRRAAAPRPAISRGETGAA